MYDNKMSRIEMQSSEGFDDERQPAKFYVYDVHEIPDPTDHRLTSMCSGDVRGQINRAHEHLLRTVANFTEGQIGLAIRFLFQPGADAGLQGRLRIQLAVKAGASMDEATVQQLIKAGPLAEFYRFESQGDAGLCFPLGQDYTSVCEVVRQEEGIEPLISREDNDCVPSLYYALYPFETQEDNDYLTIDRLLSKMEEPCALEILVQPVDHTADLASHYGYITHLMSVNAYGDDLLGESLTPAPWGEEQPVGQLLTQARKKDPIADEILRDHQELQRKLRQPQLLFHVRAFAMRPEQALMLASTVAESGLLAGKYRLVAYDAAGSGRECTWLQRSLDDSRNLDVSLHAMYPGVWGHELPANWQGMKRLCRLATVDELKGLMRLPVGGHGSPRCIHKATDPLSMDRSSSVLIGDDLESEPPKGRVTSENLSDLFECPAIQNLELRLPLKLLPKHMFVAGVPGSGKTTALFNILVQLYRHGVPFLVIEPAKTEYRILKTLREHPDTTMRAMAEEIRVYTAGNDAVSPLRFNPLAYPAGISLDEHIGQVLASFEAAMPLGGPLQALIAEAVEAVYENREEGNFPQMTDLVQAARRIMDEKQYEGEIRSNLQAAIEVRLGLLTRRAMGRIFQCYHCIPDAADLLRYPTIIEMDYLPQNHACLLTLFLLSAIREQIRVDANRRVSGLHHVTVIEEAHNIVGRAGEAKGSEDFADPKAFAAQYVARMLAELRALGEGIIIADQLPSAVAPEVVKNTGSKLAHRLVSNDDRENLGGAMLLGPTETEEIARLSPGEAYFYSEGLHKPRRVRCLNANEYLRLAESPTGDEILKHLAGDPWFAEGEETRVLMILDMMEDHFPGLIEAIGNASTQVEAMAPDQINLAAAIEDPLRRRDELTGLYSVLAGVRDELRGAIMAFHGRIWTPQVPLIEAGRAKFETVRQRSDQIAERYEREVSTSFEEVDNVLEDILEQVHSCLDEEVIV